jgi:hypothetical protein
LFVFSNDEGQNLFAESPPDGALAPQAERVEVTDEWIHINLSNNETITASTAWFPSLLAADASEREDWRPIQAPPGVRWDSLDEDISLELLAQHLRLGTRIERQQRVQARQPLRTAWRGSLPAVDERFAERYDYPTHPSTETARFYQLYCEITTGLTDFIDNLYVSGDVTPAEHAWFNGLINGFRSAYQRWPLAPNGHVRTYLQLFATRNRHLRLAAHAFLHIAFDLPRVIADSLVRVPESERWRYRTLFVRSAPRLREVFRRHLALLS